ncbi:MAG: hypothetical protein AAF744_15895 [Pseudomonadota bacterium]
MAAHLPRVKASANEVMSLAARAARGAGAPPAQASAFGAAALRHLAAGRASEHLSDALNALPKGPIMTLPAALTRLLESAQGPQLSGKLPAHVLSASYAEAQPFAASFSATADGPIVTYDLTAPATKPAAARVTLPDALAAKLHQLAARTYVPETESSRLSGAGAGLTDND